MNDDLLISHMLGEATPGESARVQEWLSEAPEHRQHYEEFEMIWRLSRGLKFEGKPDAAASLQRLEQKIAAQHSPEPTIRRMAPWIRIAAALILLSAFAWLFANYFSVKEVQFLTQQTVKTDTLSDGSVVTLNKNSLLRFPEQFKGRLRQVSMAEGEAFFKIRADKARPFLISAGKVMIRVVGTSFNVKNRNGLTEVIVATGIVQVSLKEQLVTLQPGEKVLFSADGEELIKARNTDHLYNYYCGKEFVAKDTPLWRMVQVLNEAYGSHIQIGRKELSGLLLNTTFKNESLSTILQVICKTFNLRMEKKNNRIILY